MITCHAHSYIAVINWWFDMSKSGLRPSGGIEAEFPLYGQICLRRMQKLVLEICKNLIRNGLLKQLLLLPPYFSVYLFGSIDRSN